MKKSSVFEWHKQFQVGHKDVEVWKKMKEVVIQDLKELMKVLKKCWIWCIQTDI